MRMKIVIKMAGGNRTGTEPEVVLDVSKCAMSSIVTTIAKQG